MDPLGSPVERNHWSSSPTDDSRREQSISPLGPRSPLPGEPVGHYRPAPPPASQPAAAQEQPRTGGGLQPRQAQVGPDEDDERRRRSNSFQSTNKQQQQPAGPPFLRVKVIGLDKNKRECYIKFNAETNLAAFKHSAYKNVSRSFGEFQKYAEAVASNCPQSIVPALPLTATSALKDEDDDRLVKLGFHKWLASVCEDPSLRRDDETRLFIESEFGYIPSTKGKRRVPIASSSHHSSASSSAVSVVSSSTSGLLKTVGVGTSLGASSSSSAYVDPDDELSVTRAAMAKLETSLVDVHKHVERASKSRRAVASSLVDLGEAWNTLSSVERHASLATAFKKMSIASKRQADIAASLAVADSVSLGDVTLYQGANARAARETLVCREQVADEYRSAVKATLSRKKAIERLKGSSNIKADRVDEALEELEDAQRHETTLSQKLSAISAHLAPSVRSHSKRVHEDLASALLQYAQANLTHESQLLKDFELLKPELDAVSLPSSGSVYYHPAAAASSTGATAAAAAGRQDATTMSRQSSAATTISPNSNHQQSAAVVVRDPNNVNSRPAAAAAATSPQKWKKVDARMAASMLSKGF